MIRTGELIEESNDVGPHRIARVAFEGDEKDVMLIDFGGMVSAPIKGALMMLLPADDQEGKFYAVALAPPGERIDGNKPGENRAKNLKTGALFEQTNDAETNITDGAIKLEANTITIKGSVIIEGDITHTGNNTQSGVHTDSNGPHTA